MTRWLASANLRMSRLIPKFTYRELARIIEGFGVRCIHIDKM